jgi:hypothetical protein
MTKQQGILNDEMPCLFVEEFFCLLITFPSKYTILFFDGSCSSGRNLTLLSRHNFSPLLSLKE